MPSSVPEASICSIASTLADAVVMTICVPPPASSERTTRISAVDASDLEGGRGLFLMQELVDDLEFVRDREGTHVKLTKRWDPQGATTP